MLSAIGILAAIIYGLALTLLAVYGLHSLWLLWRFFRVHRQQRQIEQDEAAGILPVQLPQVLVQLPVYNERDVVRRLLDAVAELRWPRNRLHIQLLDDSSDDSVAIGAQGVTALVEQGLQAEQITRRDRTGFKAGALQVGMARNQAPFIAIFDADFVPQPDFLERAIRPLLADDGLALVQGRWEHLNPEENALTRAQAIGIDSHFAIEQGARAWGGLAMNFNGTCGLWRRAAIDDAGGWEHDTLTEDLDLSYRVQLRGWRCTYRLDLAVPGELPSDIHAFRAQQFRWAKGSQQCTRKLTGRVWASAWPLPKKIASVLHMSHYAVHPGMLLSLLTAPLALLLCPTPSKWVLGLGALAFVIGVSAPIITYIVSQYLLRDRAWYRTLARIPLLAAIGTGIAISNSRAVAEAWRGVVSPFVRTPKRGARQGSYRAATSTGLPELLAGCWAVVGVIASLSIGRPWATPLLLIYTSGFFVVGAACLQASRPALAPKLALTACGLVWLLGIGSVAWQPQAFAQQPLAYAGFGLLSGSAYLLASRWRQCSGRGVLALILGFALLGRVLALGLPISDDLNRYVIEGRQLALGQNPYVVAPAEAGELLANDPAAELIPGANHPDWTAIYPPAALYAQALIADISPNVTGMRLAMLVVEALALLVLAALLHARGLPTAMLLLAAWNPVLPFWISGEGHNDALMLLALVVGLWAFQRGRGAIGSIAATVAVLCKPFAVAALAPSLGQQGRRWLWLPPLLTLALLLPVLDAGSGLLGSLGRFGTEKHFHGALEPLLRGTLHAAGIDAEQAGSLVAGALVGLLILGSVVLIRQHRGDAMELGAKLMALLLLCLPTLHPWYLAGLVVMLPFLPHPALLLWTACAPLYWLHGLAMDDGRAWMERYWVTALAHGPAVLLLLWTLLRRRRLELGLTNANANAQVAATYSS